MGHRQASDETHRASNCRGALVKGGVPAVEPGQLDLTVLEPYLRGCGVPIAGALQASAITGGRSNLTYRLDDGQHVWVLRRPPDAGVTPSAHDVGREFRVMSALQQTALPVPRTVLECRDESVIGAPFTVVDFSEGSVLRTRTDLAAISDDLVGKVHWELIRVLALLHSLPYDELGLSDFGRPEGFVNRQIELWRRQWDHVATREMADVDRLYQALVRSPPPQSSFGIVHGDFRVDNALIDLTTGQMTALVDWEMATIGDPLTDVAMMCAYQHSSFDHVVGEAAAATSERWPSPDAFARHYADEVGINLDGWGRYLALAHLKLAVIAEGIAARYRAGVGEGTGFATAHRAVPELLASGLRYMAADGGTT
jgi:aminoglycoside phosphotransferase (APT) family kinase protein